MSTTHTTARDWEPDRRLRTRRTTKTPVPFQRVRTKKISRTGPSDFPIQHTPGGRGSNIPLSEWGCEGGRGSQDQKRCHRRLCFIPVRLQTPPGTKRGCILPDRPTPSLTTVEQKPLGRPSPTLPSVPQLDLPMKLRGCLLLSLGEERRTVNDTYRHQCVSTKRLKSNTYLGYPNNSLKQYVESGGSGNTPDGDFLPPLSVVV